MSVADVARRLPRGMKHEDKLVVLRFLFDDDRIDRWYGSYGVHSSQLYRTWFEDMLVGMSVPDAHKLCGEMHLELEDAGRGVSLVATGDRIGYVADKNDTITEITMIDFDPSSFDQDWLEKMSFFEHHLVGLTPEEATRRYKGWGIRFIPRDTIQYPKCSFWATGDHSCKDAADVIHYSLDERGRIDEVCIEHYKRHSLPDCRLHLERSTPAVE